MEDKFTRSAMDDNTYIEDFRDSSHNWDINNSANGTLNNAEIDGFIGTRRIRITSAGTVADYANFQRNNSGNEEIKLGLGIYKLQFLLHIDNVPDGVNDFIIRAGVMNVSNQYDGIDNGVFFKIQNSDGGNFQAVSMKDGVPTITDTGVPAVNNVFYKFKIRVNEDGSKINFFIADGQGSDYVLVATHTTNIPTAYIGLLFGIEPAASLSNTRNFDLDYVKEKYMISNGR